MEVRVDVLVGNSTVSAFVEAGKWRCTDRKTLIRLQNIPPVTGYHPDRDAVTAQRAATFLGGRVIDLRPKQPGVAIPGRID